MSSCEELHGEHFVVNSHLNYLLAFFSSLENTKGALKIVWLWHNWIWKIMLECESKA